MEKILPNGTEVLIFQNRRIEGNDYEYTKGVVVSSELSDDLSRHGSPWYEQIYTVEDKEGNKYRGCHGQGVSGDSYFRTQLEQVEFLQYQIERNNDKIKKLQGENYEITTMINSINNEYNPQIKSTIQAIADYINSLNLTKEQKVELLKEYEEKLNNPYKFTKRRKIIIK